MCFYHGKNTSDWTLKTIVWLFVYQDFIKNVCLDVTRVSDLLSACLSSVYLPGRFILVVNKQTFLSKKQKKTFVCYAWTEDRPLIETAVPDKTKQCVQRCKVNIRGCSDKVMNCSIVHVNVNL